MWGLTYGLMADAVVVCPSLMSREDVRDGVALTRKGGTCVPTGMTSQLTQSVKINLQEFILMNKTLAGTIFGSCNPKADIDRLARLYQTGQLMLDEMITRTLPPRRHQRCVRRPAQWRDRPRHHRFRGGIT